MNFVLNLCPLYSEIFCLLMFLFLQPNGWWFYVFLLAGHRLIKIAKSSISPSVGFFFRINASGISLLENEGVEMSGPEANSIHCQGLTWTFSYFLYILEGGDISIINKKYLTRFWCNYGYGVMNTILLCVLIRCCLIFSFCYEKNQLCAFLLQ